MAMMQKRYFPKTYTGHEIPLRTNTDCILYNLGYGTEQISLTQKIDGVLNKLRDYENLLANELIHIESEDYIQNKPYKKNTILTHNGQTFISTKDTRANEPKDNSQFWLPLSPRLKNICLLEEKFDIGTKEYTIISDYGYTYDSLSKLLQSGEFIGLINNGDYIWVGCLYGKLKLVANVDVHYNPNTENKTHCIDFICTEIKLTNDARSAGSNLFELDTNLMSNVNISDGLNNIILSNFFPSKSWLMKSIFYKNSIALGLSDNFLSHIVDKYKNVIVRNFDKKNNNITNKTDYGIANVNLGRSWILYEGEIKTFGALSSLEESMMCAPYPIFEKYDNRQVIVNGRRLGILTSSLLAAHTKTKGYPEYSQLDLNPIMIKNNISKVYTNAYRDSVYPMFGTRFV